ncbi:lung seven transmembrane receptor-domain-containing protein [Multifurca ochricompacta]|uniref:Lung seven transmembrane receptor-domain-containing protein n=1 Tax=Multifurca ochricompacta TaxID=376703 RepID=A0AAD4MDR7_9AGAM|nr:lung seven transmembrane receptor-domain-containing protein [Multifurca ochricompacta]
MTRSYKLLFWRYEVPILDTDYSRQICSGMWSGRNTFINVSFESASQGQLAMVIYEWNDYQYLGKVTSETDEYLPRTYVCTSDAVRGGFCDSSDLGRFILDLPTGKSIEDTSFWSARVSFPESERSSGNSTSQGFWDNPAGNPTPPSSVNASPFRRGIQTRQNGSDPSPSPSGLFAYHEPIQYPIRKTGYYCVAVVPVTVLQNSPSPTPQKRQSSDVHPSYRGTVLFRNIFDGQLAATDYPKVNFYLIMLLLYSALAAAWGWLCYKHVTEILPLQYYLSCLVGFLIIEMVANLAYYRYLNAHGKGTASTVFLFVVATLDAGRNSLSFFMLLVVSLGLSVVRDDLGPTMRKAQILSVAHFVFGVLYAVGIVELEFESASALVLLLFVVPLAFTLSGFLMWILWSLNATISQLKARKQHYKLRMFQRLQYILFFVVFVISIFFVVSTLTFTGRLAEDYAAKSWKIRWWLLDGWLSLLYFFAFGSIAYLWRPSANNSR